MKVIIWDAKEITEIEMPFWCVDAWQLMWYKLQIRICEWLVPNLRDQGVKIRLEITFKL